MSARVTLERSLRDEGDAAAQTVRGWTLQIADGRISIGGREPGSAKFTIRVADIGASWVPRDRYQFKLNETCGARTCKGALIALRRGWTDDDLRRLFRQRAVATADGCLVWTGPRTPDGYARMSVRGRHQFVHRIAWELSRAPIPDGHQVDHLCRNRACVNVDHLEPVTQAENLRREWEARRAA